MEPARILHHTAIEVADLDGAIAWYHDHLGFRFERRFELPDAGIAIAYLTSSALRIELLRRSEPSARSRYTAPESGSAGSPTESRGLESESSAGSTGSGSDFRPSMHICFEVEDIQTAADELRRRGVEFAQEPKLIAPAGVRNLWIRAFEGHLIEFLEVVE